MVREDRFEIAPFGRSQAHSWRVFLRFETLPNPIAIGLLSSSFMPTERDQIEATIGGLEAQRGLLGDTFVDSGIASLRERLAALVPESLGSNGVSQTLKQVTILFLDIVGSTTLSQSLDPEENYAVMNDALARGTAIVEAHEGKVLQYAGDNLLAVFGAEEAREDDPERAVRCGLALLSEFQLIGAEVTLKYRHEGFNARVGVHTGHVLLGGGVEADKTIRGIAVSIAARMEQTAPAGGLRISHDAYRHVRGVFDVEPQPPLQVKGVPDPMVTYLIVRAKPRAFRVATRGIEGIETRMIGREAELALLQNAFTSLFNNGTMQAIRVVGDAGLGKSRLLYEFENWAEARPESFILFHGRASPSRQSQPYGLLRDILAWRLELADSDTMPVAKEKIENGIAPLFVADDGESMAQAHAHILGHLIGLDFSDSPHVAGILDDAKQIHDRAFHAASRMFRLMSRSESRPILINLEDLHWADEGSLDFLAHLVRVNGDLPMMVLGLTRPTAPGRRPDRSEAEKLYKTIDLKPLDRLQSRELVNELLKRLTEIPAALRELVTGGAEGNPFYMEELVKMLVDQGAIEMGPEHWTVRAEKLLSTHIPSSLTGVVQARLDELPGAERAALQRASVIGLTFSDETLRALDANAPAALPSLLQRELILPRPEGRSDSVREYSFSHQILHSVTYSTILKRDRRELHARTASWLARLTGSRAGDFLGDTAEHYEKAEDIENATEFYTRAAEQAKGRFAYETALGYIERALPHAQGASGDRSKWILHWRLLDARERILNTQGRRPEQRADLVVLEQLAEDLEDDRRRAELAIRRSQLGMRTSDWNIQVSAAREAIEFARRAEDTERRLYALRLLASALPYLGRIAEGAELAEQGIAEARAHGLRRAESLLLGSLSVIASMRGDLAAYLDMAERTLVITRELGDRQNEAVYLGNLGDCWLELGDLTQAQHTLHAALKLMRSVGTRSMEPVLLLNLSSIAYYLGDHPHALSQAQEAVNKAAEVQARDFEMGALWACGNAALALGDQDAAAASYMRSFELARTMDPSWQQATAAALARLYLASGDLIRATEHVEPILAENEQTAPLEITGLSRLTLWTCHNVLSRTGDGRAGALLEKLHTDLEMRAATISDAQLRWGFLNNIPHHRDIVAAWTGSKSPATA